jgi:hypothetical protein
MLLYLEDMFKNASQTTRTVVPNKLGQIVLVEDILILFMKFLPELKRKWTLCPNQTRFLL